MDRAEVYGTSGRGFESLQAHEYGCVKMIRMKICSRCKAEKSLEEFHRRGTGYQSACMVCHRQYVKNHYTTNRDYYLEKSAKQTRETRAWLQSLKESLPCTDCGEFFPYYVTQFDHVRGEKEFNISGSHRKGQKAVLSEIQKCDLVCANCHAVRTWTRMQEHQIDT